MNNGYTEIDGKFYQEHSVVMLSTLNAASLGLTKSNRLMLAPLQTKWQLPYSNGFIGQHLYFLSDEEIKEGDWCYSIRDKVITQCKNTNKSFEEALQYKKIIATTDTELHCDKDWNGINIESPYPRPSNSFIEKFVSEWNAGNVIKSVLIEYEDCWVKVAHSLDVAYKLKVAPDNTITIKPLVVKDSWNEKELTNIIFKFKDTIALELEIDADSEVFDFKKISKWIKQNL